MAKSSSIFAGLVLTLFACQLMTIEPTDTPTATLDQKGTDVAKTAEKATDDQQATSAAQATLDVNETSIAQITYEAGATKTQKSVDYLSTYTQIASTKSAATAESGLKATQNVAHLVDEIQELANHGEISTTSGDFHQIDDLEKEVAKINYFNYWETGYSAENFAIEADIAYDVASDKANWFNTGCGFVFGEHDQDKFHFLKLSLDGMATLRSFNGDTRTVISQKSFGKPSLPSGRMHVFLVVQDKRVHLVIDDKPILNSYCPLIKPGSINLSLSSGINSGFGTRCEYTNVGLWIFE